MPEAAGEFVVEAHLAAGDTWVLSRGRRAATGEPVLLVTGGAGGPDPAEVRRRLAVAGSVASAHLAPVSTVEGAADGGVVVAVPAPAGPSLATLTAARGPLAPAEAVTVVAPLAATLATLHARGLELAGVTAATVWLAADGRPVLVPVGLRSCGVDGSCLDGRAATGDDVAGLAATVLSVVDRTAGQGAALVAALEAAVDGRLDAAGLEAAVLRSGRALPIGAAALVAVPRAGGSPPRRPVAALVCAVAVVGIVLGGLWGRQDGETVLAAPPLPSSSESPAPSPSPSPSPRPTPDALSWRTVMASLERARARSFATADPTSLAAVYARGSPTGRADLRLLRGLARHGQHAAGLRAFVERADTLARGEDRATLLVTDALTAYDVVTADGRVVRHGAGRPSTTWRVTLVDTSHGWRIWSVSRNPE